jgi:integral membrane protein
MPAVDPDEGSRTHTTASAAMSPADSGAVRPAAFPHRGALLRYRVMAYITGVMLLLLVFVAIPLKYFGHHPGPVVVIGTAHGYLFIVYLATALHLGILMRWPLLRLGLIMLAGTIPFMSFVAERSVVRQVRGLTVGR